MKPNEEILQKMREATKKLMASGPAAATAARPVVPGNFMAELLTRLRIPDGLQTPEFVLPTFSPSQLSTPPSAPQPEDASSQGRFILGSYGNQAGRRDYKLYIPSSYNGQDLPLMVMLHGCTQNPDDFATGTRMNAIAEEKQCFVVYPSQSQSANTSRCWNWFKAIDQQRDQGEPSLIAGITRQIISTQPIDASRVYIAGMSAGGAMAVIMGTLYPDLYAAVGVHSGLPYASAHDLPSALAAMKGGAAGRPAGNGSAARATARLNAIPIIVFHGDRDTTVHPRNGEKVMAQNVPQATLPARGHSSGTASMATPAQGEPMVLSGKVPNGHAYTRTMHKNDEGRIVAEHWRIHGAAHAWSGGSKFGTYTDAQGPDASQEMMRFFYTQANKL